MAAGLIIWAGFMVFGFIARRYSFVFSRPTFYGLLMAAPSGILIYSLLLIFKGAMFIKDGAVSGAIQTAAYVFLAVSSVLCLAAVIKFNRLLKELVEYRGRE